MAHVEFLSYIFILVYVGGIAILFLFIIIMLNIKVSKVNKKNDVSSNISGFMFLLLVLIKIQSTFYSIVSTSFINSHYVKLFSNMVIPSFQGDNFLYRILSNDIVVFGMILYTHYVFYFILVGIILLVTMICVLVLSLSEGNQKPSYDESFKHINKNKKNFSQVDYFNSLKKSHTEKIVTSHTIDDKDLRIRDLVGEEQCFDSWLFHLLFPEKEPTIKTVTAIPEYNDLISKSDELSDNYNNFKTWYFWDHELPYLHWPVFEKFIDSFTFLPIENLITYSFMLFFLSIIGLLFNNTKNVISFMLFVELMLFSLSFLSIVFSLMWISPEGQIFALFIMSIAVSESAIGLGLLIASFRISKRIELDNFSYLRG